MLSYIYIFYQIFCANYLSTSKTLFTSTSEEIIPTVSVLTQLENKIIPKGNSKQYSIPFFIRLESTDFILKFPPLLIYSAN